MIDVTGSLPPLKVICCTSTKETQSTIFVLQQLQVGKLDIDFSLAFLEENLKAGEKKNVETKITESGKIET